VRVCMHERNRKEVVELTEAPARDFSDGASFYHAPKPREGGIGVWGLSGWIQGGGSSRGAQA